MPDKVASAIELLATQVAPVVFRELRKNNTEAISGFKRS
jgi:hypothetical protein